MSRPRGLDILESVLLAVLLALAAITFTGYRFGDSNHSISIPILKHLMEPSLYPGDIIVATAPRYTTVTYRLLAAALPGPDAIPGTFFVLHVLTAAALFAGAYRLGAWAGGGAAAGVLTALASVPVRIGVAGATLYRPAFTHSSLSAAIGVWAVAWFLEGRRLLPLLVLSIGAYNHILYSAYLLVPLLSIVLWEWRERGTRRTLPLLAAAVLPLLPLAGWQLSQSTPMTSEWLELLRLRSAHHSFPSTFGGNLAPVAFLLVLGALIASRFPEAQRRLFALFAAGIALEFVVGTLLSEAVPLKPVLQLQPHRSWAFLALVLHAVIAAGVIAGVRAGGMSRAAALAVAAAAFVPGFEPLLPAAVLIQAFAGRPAPEPWARLVAVAATVMFASWVAGVPDFTFLQGLPEALSTRLTVEAVALMLLLLWARTSVPRLRTAAVAVAALALVLWVGPAAYRAARLRWEWGPWRDVQIWVRDNTARHAVVLTPPKETGFRVFSERTIVGEWKDGTQQYFDDAFAREWDARMRALEPERFNRLSRERLQALAERYGADYLVLAAPPLRPGLELAFQNAGFAVYRMHPSGAR